MYGVKSAYGKKVKVLPSKKKPKLGTYGSKVSFD